MLREQTVSAAFPAQHICQYKVMVGNLEICLPQVGPSEESAVTAYTGKLAGVPAVFHTDPFLYIVCQGLAVQVKGSGSHKKSGQNLHQLPVLRTVIMFD